MSSRNWLFPLLLSSFSFAAVGCGQMRDAKDAVADKTVDLKDKTQDKAQSLAERTDRWLNDEPMQQRFDACVDEGGEWTERIVVSECKDGLATIEFDGEHQEQECEDGAGGEAEQQCLHRSQDGLVYYNDGPSVPSALQRISGVVANRTDYMAFNRLFWSAGVNHDYCYHHGSITYGYDKKACDEQYFRDLSAVCANPESEEYSWFDGNVCRKIALSHYSAVRQAGEEPFNMQNTRVGYPKWQPLWQQFGLKEDPTNEAAMADIDNPTRRVSLR